MELQHNNTQDRYGRTIGILYLNNQNLNKLLVEGGYAWYFKKYSSDVAYDNLEKEAREQKRGLWQAENPVSP